MIGHLLFGLLVQAGPAQAEGLAFECRIAGADALHVGVGDFRVFAPSEEATAGYRGNVLALYRVSGPEKSFLNPERFEQVEDYLPQSLTISWRREHNSPVTLEIADHDAAAGTARYTIHTERNPAARLHTPLAITGSCTVAAQPGEMTQ